MRSGLKKNGSAWFDANLNGMNVHYFNGEDTFFTNEAKSFESFGFFNIDTVNFPGPTKESIMQRNASALSNGFEDIKDLDLTIPFHFAFCHALEVTLVVYTHHKGSLTMTTQVYDYDTKESSIAHYDKCNPTSFSSCPYQILAHQPSDEDDCWKYDVIVIDPTKLDTVQELSRATNQSKVGSTAKLTSGASKDSSDKSGNKKKSVINDCNLPEELEKQFEETLEAEKNYEEKKNRPCDLKLPNSHLLIEEHKKSLHEATKTFNTLKRKLEKSLRENQFANYHQLKLKKRQKTITSRQTATVPIVDPVMYHDAMLKSHKELDDNFKKRVDEVDDNVVTQGKLWEKDDIQPKDLENLKTLVENHWGNKKVRN